jgi:glycosyltransferase involved in cell wall biosynthesis
MTAGAPVILLIRSLGMGGAERQLVALANQFAARKIPIVVLTFYGGGVLAEGLQGDRFPLVNLGKRGRWDLAFPLRFAAAIRRLRPSCVYSFLTDSNVVLACVKPVLRVPIVWGIRCSFMPLDRYGRVSLMMGRLERALCQVPDLTIYNSHAGLRHHVARGYPASKATVVPNGIDTETYRPDPEGRARVRTQLNMEGFIEAARLAAAADPRLHFVSVGDGDPDFARTLREQAENAELAARFTWAGGRHDMPAVYSALDISCSMSLGEGFSNTLAESMACEVPCIATDVGDARELLGECGTVLRSSTPQAMSDAILELAGAPVARRRALGVASRLRVVEKFGVDAMASRTLALLRELHSSNA